MLKNFLTQAKKWLIEKTVLFILCITVFFRTRIIFSVAEHNIWHMRGGNHEIHRYPDEFQ